MKTETLSLEWTEGNAPLITLLRGAEMNTLTYELLHDLEAALDSLSQRLPRALIITGTGRAFCCGAHLDYFQVEHMTQDARFRLRDKYLSKIAQLFDRLEDLPFPVIAAINGYALGGGCELALSCDFRIMSQSAQIGLPEVKIGALAGAGGVQKLSRHIGRSKAMEWVLLGTHFSAAQAENCGLIFSITEPGQEVPAALNLAARMRELSPRAVAQSKRAVLACEDMDALSARRFGLEALSMLIDSSDWREGIEAFHEKRAPRFGQASEADFDNK